MLVNLNEYQVLLDSVMCIKKYDFDHVKFVGDHADKLACTPFYSQPESCQSQKILQSRAPTILVMQESFRTSILLQHRYVKPVL